MQALPPEGRTALPLAETSNDLRPSTPESVVGTAALAVPERPSLSLVNDRLTDFAIEPVAVLSKKVSAVATEAAAHDPDVLDATDYVVPALELIDGRSKYPRRIVDNIADNAACAGIILGGRPVKPLEVDLRWVAALLLKNGVIEESGVSAAVLGHPALGIAWLANKLAAHDTVLEAGHIVLAGSFTRTVAVAKGDTIHADYGPLGSISAHFS